MTSPAPPISHTSAAPPLIARSRGFTWLSSLAWLNVAVHLASLALTALAIKPGNPVTELSSRMIYLAGSPLGWTLGWGGWMLSALALIAFFAALAGRITLHTELARLSLVLAVAGAAIDLLCDMIQLSVLPMAAAGGDAST
jgi:hypothetical protein